MTSITNFLIITFVFGLAVSIFAVLVERLLILNGITRGNTLGLALVAFVASVLKQLIYPAGSLLLFGLLLVIMGVMAVNRSDITQTIYKGKWWWKS